MIRTECAVFCAMMLGGFTAACIATILLTLGRASRVARAVFDVLTPLAVGVIFIHALYLASGGVIRLYALLAFLFGGGIFRWFYGKLRPWIKKAVAALIVPIKSLEDAVSGRIEPIRKRRRERSAAKRALRGEKRRISAEKRANRREERRLSRLAKRESRSRKRRIMHLRRKARAAGERGGVRLAIRQSH